MIGILDFCLISVLIDGQLKHFVHCSNLDSESVTPFSYIFKIQESAAQYGFTLDRVGYDFTMAIVCGLAWRLIAYGVLVYTLRKQSIQG